MTLAWLVEALRLSAKFGFGYCTGSGLRGSYSMSDLPHDDVGTDSDDQFESPKIIDLEEEDYTLKREQDSYIESKESQQKYNYDRMMNERNDRWNRSLKDGTKPFNYMDSKDPQESSEEEQIIRLPSETELSDSPKTPQRSHSESMSNYFSSAAYRRNDCLNFSQQSRELAYMKHAELFENWKYADEEKAFLRHRVEMFSKEQCVIYCILGHMLMTPEEMEGVRHTLPAPDEARQALLSLAIGSHWDVYNLAIIMAFSEKLNVDNTTFTGAGLYHHEEFRPRVEQIFARLLDD